MPNTRTWADNGHTHIVFDTGQGGNFCVFSTHPVHIYE